jgi:adenylosuccinate lyase
VYRVIKKMGWFVNVLRLDEHGDSAICDRMYVRVRTMMQVVEFTHFACTSEDINNVSHALMLKAALEDCLLPAMDSVIGAMQAMATEHAGTSVLCTAT